MIISINKPLVLINNTEKKSPAAGTLPGDSLSGEQSPTARCAGAKLRQKYTYFQKKVLPLWSCLVPLYVVPTLK